MTGSGYVNATQDKMKSNFDSVQEQTGFFAGKGGYQIDVTGHTQLDGAVIGSTAKPEVNSLATGTLGWTDINNRADFSAQHQGVGFSGGGQYDPSLKQYSGNAANNLLVGVNYSGHDSSTTYSAISDGALTIRDKANQQQDVSTINHDVEHAGNALSPIFDKEKEQKRLQQAQLIAEIGNQSMDIIRTQGEIETIKAQKDPKAREEARQALAARGKTNPSEQDISNQVAVTVMEGYGTGSRIQKAAQAVTAAVQGLAGGDIAAAISGAAAPYLAQIIAQQTDGDPKANLMAHAVLGAVIAQAQGNSAAAGAAGAAVTGTSDLIIKTLYPDVDAHNLSETQKQVVSTLVTLAAGMAGALVGGDTAGFVAGTGAGRNAEENNHLTELDKLELRDKKEEYAQKCPGGAGASDACRNLSNDIAELEEKGRSVLKAVSFGSNDDVTEEQTVEYKPGEIIKCTASSGYCIVTNETIQTSQGQEWVLAEANDDQIQTAIKNEENTALRAKDSFEKKGAEYLEAGCGSSGLIGTACQLYTAKGGANPISGQEPSDTERVIAGISGVLNIFGLSGSIIGESVTKSKLPWDNGNIGYPLPKAETKGLGGTVSIDEIDGMAFGQGNAKQGFPFEKYVQNQLPSGTLDLNDIKTNFTAFDHLTPDGLAVSTKTLVTSGTTYQRPSAITNKLNKYIDQMVKFTGDGKGSLIITSDDIKSKQLQLGIPNNVSAPQLEAIQKSINYAASKNITLIVTRIK